MSDEQGEDPTVEETLKFMRCWWSPDPLVEALSDIPISSNWSEPTFSLGMPIIPNQAYSVACDLPGIKRGQEVYIGVVAIGADESSVTEGLVVISAITIAESAAPPKPNMMPVYIALGTIIQMINHINLTYFFNNAKKAKLAATKELGIGEKTSIIAKT